MRYIWYDNYKEKEKRRSYCTCEEYFNIIKRSKTKRKRNRKNIADKQFEVSKVKDKWSNGYQIGDISKSI